MSRSRPAEVRAKDYWAQMQRQGGGAPETIINGLLAVWPDAEVTIHPKGTFTNGAIAHTEGTDGGDGDRICGPSPDYGHSLPTDTGVEMTALDFSPSRYSGFAAAFQAHIDESMQTVAMEREQRDYLGGSRLGVECNRALAYEYTHTPKDPDRNFKGRTLRIFALGNVIEDLMAQWIKDAGFTLLTERAGGGQFGFGTGRDPVTNEPRIKGHLDGVITAGPSGLVGLPVVGKDQFPMAYPCLWECKSMNNKNFAKTLKEGVERSKPEYYAQMQVYMGYMDLTEHPALFTVLNKDTSEIYAELVPFNSAACQTASDKGVAVIRASFPEEFPRIGRDATDFKCKWCDYHDRCWAAKDTPAAGSVTAPAWLGGPTT